MCQWFLRLVGRASSLAVLTPLLPQGRIAWAGDRRECTDAGWSWRGLCGPLGVPGWGRGASMGNSSTWLLYVPASSQWLLS